MMIRSGRTLWSVGLVCSVAALAACGDSTTLPAVDGGPRIDAGPGVDGGPGADGGPRVDAGPAVDAGPRADLGVSSACPAVAPNDAMTCTTDGLECEYGNDPRYACRTYASCTAGAWLVTLPTGGCDPIPPVTCPATRADAAGALCTPVDAYCSYDGLNCHCTNCTLYPVVRCEGPLAWVCDAPSAVPSCPPARPRLGDSCGLANGTSCEYGCEGGQSRECRDGSWVSSSSAGGCPRSNRRLKRDIQYVDPVEAKRLADELLGTRLATYEYTDPALAGTRRLGFILDDQPTGSFAGDPTASQVDLYGYASMLVATVQDQQRQIDEMRRELRALRRARR